MMLKELKAMYVVCISTRYNARKEDQRLFYNKNSTAITFLVLERTFTKIACSIINEREELVFNPP